MAVHCDPSGGAGASTVSLSLLAGGTPRMATLLLPPRPAPRPAVRLARRRATVGHAEIDFLGRRKRVLALALVGGTAVEGDREGRAQREGHEK